MQKQSASMVSINLPAGVNRKMIMEALSLDLKRGIEACYYAELDQQRYLFVTDFAVITFINWDEAQIIVALTQLDLTGVQNFRQHFIFQDYCVSENSELVDEFVVTNDCVELKKWSLWPLMIVALAVSQSVGLERFEEKVEAQFSRGREMIHNAGRFTWMKRHQFADYAEEISLLKHDMVLDLRLLDKPNILWDNEVYELLYTRLSDLFELGDRFEVISYKLNTLKEDISMMMDLYNHKHSSFLEWIIIVLIMVEVVMGFLGIFGVIDH